MNKISCLYCQKKRRDTKANRSHLYGELIPIRWNTLLLTMRLAVVSGGCGLVPHLCRFHVHDDSNGTEVAPWWLGAVQSLVMREGPRAVCL